MTHYDTLPHLPRHKTIADHQGNLEGYVPVPVDEAELLRRIGQRASEDFAALHTMPYPSAVLTELLTLAGLTKPEA